jgi:hypothetical protein
VSLIRSIALTCDAPDCERISPGDVGHRPSTHVARLEARRGGWTFRKAGGRWWDLCPEHAHWRPRLVVVDAEAMAT